MPRVGLEHLRAVLPDDADGLVAGLDEGMQAFVDAYRDPWREGREPATAGQFRTSLPLCSSPSPRPMTRVVETEHRLGPVDDIPVGEGRAYAVGDLQIAVFRLRTGALRATQATCPHAGGPLADGQLDDSVVLCPLHAAAFALETGHARTGHPSLILYAAQVVNGDKPGRQRLRGLSGAAPGPGQGRRSRPLPEVPGTPPRRPSAAAVRAPVG